MTIGRVYHYSDEPCRCDWCGRTMWAGSSGSGVTTYTVACKEFCGERCARQYMASHGYHETVFDHWGWLMKLSLFIIAPFLGLAFGMVKGCYNRCFGPEGATPPNVQDGRAASTRPPPQEGVQNER